MISFPTIFMHMHAVCARKSIKYHLVESSITLLLLATRSGPVISVIGSSDAAGVSQSES